MGEQFRFQLYERLLRHSNEIYADVKKAAYDAGVTEELRGKIGLTGAVSGFHGLLSEHVRRAMDEGARKMVPNSALDTRVRELVKSYYGDEYDGAMVSTCEAALWVTFDTLFTPPLTGRGQNYRCRYVAPYERHMHHQAGYGRPFPARYKDLYADRGSTAGEAGLQGKRLESLDTIVVPMVGARYQAHGVKYHVVPLLTAVDPDATAEAIEQVAARHAASLVGFASLAYDTPGYGHGSKDAAGTPKLQQYIGAIAKRYNVPYVTDNAWGVPFVGTDPRRTGADVIMYSMDKAAGAPTSGLIIGREEVMIPIRRALGVHGERWGTTGAYGKAAYVTVDAGKEGLLGGIAAMELLLERPDLYTQPLDTLHAISVEEFERSALPEMYEGWLISKSYNSLAVEINYENTWHDGQLGLPVFSIEDMYSGSNVVQNAMKAAGLVPTIGYDANIFVSLGLGTIDAQGQLMEHECRVMMRALYRGLEVIGRYAGTAAGARAAASV